MQVRTLTRSAVDPLCDINASLDNVMHMNVPLAQDPHFDCSMPDLDACPPQPIGFQGSMPSPISLPRHKGCLPEHASLRSHVTNAFAQIAPHIQLSTPR